MKKWILCLLVFPITLGAQSKKIKALFLGNSYTYFNNLPQMVKDIALAAGDTLVYDSNTPGGYTFGDHNHDAVSKGKIMQGGWDFVILQAQSQEPSYQPWAVLSITLPQGFSLDSMVKVHNPCGTTVFYETWGRKFGDQNTCPFYSVVCTYTGMQNRLKDSYKLFADTTQTSMAPVGEAFRSSVTYSPGLELYSPDQSHPSLAGSYLAALVFYETLFHKPVLNNTYNAGLGATTQAFLQQTAHATVNDSLAVWNLGVNQPWAGFTSSSTGTYNFQFYSQSPGLVNTWYFGDGSQSTLSNPGHTYNTNGVYQVCHTVQKGCLTDSICQTVVIGSLPSSLPDPAIESRLLPYPNPCSETLCLSIGDAELLKSAEVRTLDGRVIPCPLAGNCLTTKHLAKGLYLLSVKQAAKIVHTPFIKE